MKREARYWIAINGASCAMATFPLRTPFKVCPTPEVLVGFQTVKEAREAQRCCLEDAIEHVRLMMCSWLKREDVLVVKPSSPEPPTKGQTMWLEE